ncbi:MAG: hypothetical protein A2213_11530 [Lysobacterales bacterium RIFOXYA1_FULL_68_6]|nr:MAG: hypothetical protein A2213_11530 [Xanthomonadales bacterium RIFOXYA1_FULL_68_6]
MRSISCAVSLTRRESVSISSAITPKLRPAAPMRTASMRAFIEMMRVMRLISSIFRSDCRSCLSSESDSPDTDWMWSSMPASGTGAAAQAFMGLLVGKGRTGALPARGSAMSVPLLRRYRRCAKAL